MNKNKLIVLLVLLIAVVGLTMGSVAAGTTTVKVKKNKVINKKLGKYTVKVYNGKYYYNNKKIADNILLVQVNKKNKVLKANKYSIKVYYKLKGKSKVSNWSTGSKKYKVQGANFKKSVKVKKVKVKIIK